MRVHGHYLTVQDDLSRTMAGTLQGWVGDGCRHDQDRITEKAVSGGVRSNRPKRRVSHNFP